MRLVDVSTKPVKDIRRILVDAKAGADEQKLVVQLADLIQKSLLLDPTQRIRCEDALKHPFIHTKCVKSPLSDASCLSASVDPTLLVVLQCNRSYLNVWHRSEKSEKTA